MKVLILTAIPFWHPGTAELMAELKKEGISVEALDIFHGRKVNSNNEIIDLIGFPTFIRRIYLKFFRQQFVNKHIPKDVIVDVHFIEPLYSKYLLQLPNKIICCLFGSDLFRTNNVQKEKQHILYKRANGILLSENMVEEFEKHFSNLKHKYFFNQYGSSRIKLISEEKRNIGDFDFHFPENKKIVCCGYNAKKEQQHFKIITSLKKQKSNLTDKVHLVFPLTYGDVGGYVAQLQKELETSGFTYSLFTKRMSDHEIVKLWKSIDISINMQTTDALSSSIKEAMAARNVMLIGEWLHYDIYTKMGIEFEKINFENLADRLINTLTEFDNYYNKTINNETIIYKFASWKYLIKNWVVMYKKVEENG